MRRTFFVIAIAVLAIQAGLRNARADESAAPVITPQQIEADWLKQDEVRKPGKIPTRPAAAGNVTTRQDAAGGCDGVIDGAFGFHTTSDENPWWQVDLGDTMPLEKALLYNRCNGNVEDRAGHLKILLSEDGKNWREVYQHNGTIFRGQPDGKPLAVALKSAKARFLRVQLPGRQYLHLDEVEVFRAGSSENVARGRPADQSSVSEWSVSHPGVKPAGAEIAGPGAAPVGNLSHVGAQYPMATVLERGVKLAEDLRRLGANIDSQETALRQAADQWRQLPPDAPDEARRKVYFQARWAVRRMALANPLLDFDDLLFVKRVPGSFTHMCDQYYGWFSRPGGGLYVLEKFKTDAPRVRCLSTGLPTGSVLRPELSHDGKTVLFAHCKYYPKLAGEPNKLDKGNVPEDAFYHLYEINLDGRGLRRLTRGKYDDFDGRYLPDGRIVFLSTRRGQYVQCGRESGMLSIDGANPDSYVRCGGGASRPVAVYTLHVLDAQGSLTQISAFEMFEWTPSIDHQGRILYSRWDYVDRYNMPFMKLWSTNPDGTNAQIVWGNFIRSPHCSFEPRAIPNSHKIIFTGSGHHALPGGPLLLLDPHQGADNPDAVTRLTPEVCCPEAEGWPASYFAGPMPLSEEHYLVAWSFQPCPLGAPPAAWGAVGAANDLGLYLFDSFGNLNLLYRDPAIGSETPLPVKPRTKPPQLPSTVAWEGEPEGRMLVANVYDGLGSAPPGTIRRLRVVGVPPKTHPNMNFPNLGITHDDPGKFVVGTVPVEKDGSAFFRVPAGVSIFFQTLDADGIAVQTMRSATYVQPGQSVSCVGCHEPRTVAPRPAAFPLAMRRGPSKITPGPEGSWPLDYQNLVQPVLERHCTHCHKPGGEGAKTNLTAAKSYDVLVAYGRPSLGEHVRARYQASRSIPGAGAAATNALLPLLKKGHYKVDLSPDDWDRLITWMDTYGQRLGSFDKNQEQRLVELRKRMGPMLEQ